MGPMSSQVALLRTRPESVVEDYGRLMRLVKYDQTLPRDQDLILKLNLSWTKYFPACSSQPWQVDGVLKTLTDDGYDRRRIFPVENKTVVTDPVEGCRNNKWAPVLKRHGVPFIPLPDVEWIVDPLAIPYLKMCHERGLGVADPREIEIVGDTDAAALNMGFKTSRSLVIWGDQLIRRGPLRPLKRLLLHSPLVVWAPFASNVYHDLLWYPTVGRARIRAFAATPWGRLFGRY